MTQVWDKKTWTQYAYFENGGLVSFDNENAICAKVQYVIENELGGFIIWELSGDMMEDLSTPLLGNLRVRLPFHFLSDVFFSVQPLTSSLFFCGPL